ncbi:MAG TPA: BTAD domain-containing putative transcriptional regulator [Actinospica sp.]|nr:BTAD domain-containing putative transcriptional regulator [Actinospica sp.]
MDYASSALSLGILGPMEASRDGRALELGPFKQRVVLGMLLCRPNKVVSIAALADAVWPDAMPRTARKNLQVYVWALRKILCAPQDGRRILHRPPGYVLEVGAGEADALRFAELARAGREAARAGDASAARLLEQALRLWRGPVLADLVASPALLEEATRLNEQYLGVYEDWAEAKLGLGEHEDVLDGIEDLVQRYPFRERLRRAQILALTRTGRHTEALAQFDAMRQALARELGLEPSPVLARLYESILTGGEIPDTEPPRREIAAGARSGPGRDIADFTGRADHVRTLLELFGGTDRSPGRIVVISGPAGVGKTALAVRCSRLRRLVIVDDAATEAQLEASLEAISGGVDVLVTSRHRLSGVAGVVHVALGPMPDSEAVEFLARLIGADRVAAEPEAARQLAQACGGLPLALRIAGAKLDALRHVTLARYVERLADDERVLDELAIGELRIRTRLATAYEALPAGDQATLRAMAGLETPQFAASELANVLGTDAARAEVAVERLIEAHVVEVLPADDGYQYVLPRLTRVYVRALAHRSAASPA